MWGWKHSQLLQHSIQHRMEKFPNKYSTSKYHTSSLKPYRTELQLSSWMWNHEVLADSYWDFGETCHLQVSSKMFVTTGQMTGPHIISSSIASVLLQNQTLWNLTLGLPAGSVESTLHIDHILLKHSFLILQSFFQNINAVQVLSIYIWLNTWFYIFTVKIMFCFSDYNVSQRQMYFTSVIFKF